MGVNMENGFEPIYITIRGKGKILQELQRKAKNSQKVLLATDPDREGEAISWHLFRSLKKHNSNIDRIEFHEITKEALLESIKNPRGIDMLKVNSQQARRILDRVVGYSLSPVIQEKFGSKRFSAGRVQSACLKIICEREQEIQKFVPKEYWNLFSFWKLAAKGSKAKKKDTQVPFSLVKINDKPVEIGSKKELDVVVEFIKNNTFYVSKNKSSTRTVRPLAPFITSRLQQEASNRLGFRAQKTMYLAQNLYEGISIGNNQVAGLVTYIRTDSVRISGEGIKMARQFIQSNFDKDYLPESPNFFQKKGSSQDAHEAIRPTSVNRTPDKMRPFLTPDQWKLYRLIWARFVSSQMKAAVDANTTIEISNQNSNTSNNTESIKSVVFRFSGSKEVFNGFRAVWDYYTRKDAYIPNFLENAAVLLENLQEEQKFTQPPARYTESSLIKIMEETGIGRPATYVPTIFTLEKRIYIERKAKQLVPTKLGMLANSILTKHFLEIVDIDFTADMEKDLDMIAFGKKDWQTILGDFVKPFIKQVEEAKDKIPDHRDLVTVPINEKCPLCEKELLKRLGRNGFFIGCSGFVDGCRYTRSIPLGSCPKCKKGFVIKKTSKARKRVFYGCDQYGETGCEFVMYQQPSAKACPKCSSLMGQKVKKREIEYTCQSEECQFVMREITDE